MFVKQTRTRPYGVEAFSFHFFMCVCVWCDLQKETRRPSWHIFEGFEGISERREACVPHQDRRIRLMLLASGIPGSSGC